MTKFLGFISLLLLVAACTPTTALPTPTSEALLIDGNLPKSIVTIEIAAIEEQTPTLSPEQTLSPTPTQPLPTLPFNADTATPYVGVFLGEPTSVSDDGQIIIPPTIPAVAFSPNAGGNIPPINAPNVVSSGSGVTVGSCTLPIASPFANVYATFQSLGCPTNGGSQVSLVTQRFERGRMFWRDSLQIIVTSDGGQFWREVDSWSEGIPADDPALVPPSGLLQPVRGFGLIWRNNSAYQDALGWALGPEFSLSSTWQDFEGGALFLGENNLVYAIPNGGSGQFRTATP